MKRINKKKKALCEKKEFKTFLASITVEL